MQDEVLGSARFGSLLRQGNPKSLNPPEMIQVQVASVSEMNTKQQNDRGNLACETKVFRIFTQFP